MVHDRLPCLLAWPPHLPTRASWYGAASQGFVNTRTLLKGLRLSCLDAWDTFRRTRHGPCSPGVRQGYIVAVSMNLLLAAFLATLFLVQTTTAQPLAAGVCAVLAAVAWGLVAPLSRWTRPKRHTTSRLSPQDVLLFWSGVPVAGVIAALSMYQPVGSALWLPLAPAGVLLLGLGASALRLFVRHAGSALVEHAYQGATAHERLRLAAGSRSKLPHTTDTRP